jgi:hypothetical protein
VTIWADYQKCPVCFAEIGKHCLTRSGYGALSNGVPFYPEVAAEQPHSTRKLRAESARAGGNRG